MRIGAIPGFGVVPSIRALGVAGRRCNMEKSGSSICHDDDSVPLDRSPDLEHEEKRYMTRGEILPGNAVIGSQTD